MQAMKVDKSQERHFDDAKYKIKLLICLHLFSFYKSVPIYLLVCLFLYLFGFGPGNRPYFSSEVMTREGAL